MSCAQEESTSAAKEQQPKKEKLSYNKSDFALETEIDSLSYVLGSEMSRPFISDTVFSKLNKSLILMGFKEDITTYSVDSCMSVVQSYMSSVGLREDEGFASKCARSVGRLNRSEIQKTFSSLNSLDLINIESIQAGFDDGLSMKDVFIDDTTAVNILFASLRTQIDGRYQIANQANQKEGIEFLKTNKDKKGVKRTPSGLQYKILKKGKGPQPSASSRVKVNYKGSLLSGEVFDSSYERGTPADFGLNQVIPGWTEGIQLMKAGSKFEFYIPHELAYGANPRPGGIIKPYSLLIFEVELLEILTP